MFQINKNEPSYFTKAKSNVKYPKRSDAWNDKNITNIRSKLREYILNEEQKGLCVYCERKIKSTPQKSNIDHFKKRDLFPQLTLDYNNLFVSCNTKDCCSTHKDTNIKSKDDYDKIVNPTVDNPGDYFEYLTTGEIVAKNDKEKADYTISIFNLGNKEKDDLVQCRKQVAEAVRSCCASMKLDEILDEMGYEYQSFITNIYNKLKGA